MSEQEGEERRRGGDCQVRWSWEARAQRGREWMMMTMMTMMPERWSTVFGKGEGWGRFAGGGGRVGSGCGGGGCGCGEG
eukprot:5385994-Pleurochrysis_carterae.AAC.1